MKKSSVAKAQEPPLSDCGWGHEGRIIWIAEAYPSAAEGLLVDSRNADESDEEDMKEYFGDDYMRGEHDRNRVTFAVLNLLGPFLFVFGILEI